MLKFQCKNFLEIKEYPSVDDSEAKKRLDGVWIVWVIVEWFTVADFLYMLEPMFTTTEQN